MEQQIWTALKQIHKLSFVKRVQFRKDQNIVQPPPSLSFAYCCYLRCAAQILAASFSFCLFFAAILNFLALASASSSALRYRSRSRSRSYSCSLFKRYRSCSCSRSRLSLAYY